jgi:hypothetical protein
VVRAPAAAGAPDEGTAVLLDANPGALHLFDGSTGRRLVA